MPTRVDVFVDYMNCYRRAREAFCPGSRSHVDGQVDPLRLAELLCGDREPAAVRVYRGMPSSHRDPKAYGAADRQIARWNRLPGVSVITRPLNYRVPSVPKEKGIDVRIAVDMVLRAAADEFDVGVLVSEDTDLVPALEAIVAMKGDRAVEIMAWLPANGKRPLPLWIPGARIRAHRLAKGDYMMVRDATDYTKP